MTQREEQAYNDGRMAYREAGEGARCGRKSPAQRAAWMRGFERERRMDRAAKATPEQLRTSAELLRQLKDYVASL